jgi:hypothetical protein
MGPAVGFLSIESLGCRHWLKASASRRITNTKLACQRLHGSLYVANDVGIGGGLTVGTLFFSRLYNQYNFDARAYWNWSFASE